MVVGAQVCDLIDGFLWFVCGLYVGILTSPLRRDLDKYHRSLRLKNHFKNDLNVATERSSIGPFNDTSSLKLQSKSKWDSPMGSNNLETIITMNELGLQDNIPQCPQKRNINNDQAKAIKELSSNAD